MAQKLYFLATDKQGFEDLWWTDGTTTEAVGGLGDRLGSPGVSGAALSGLGPTSITQFGQQMIFAGADALNDGYSNGVWLTNGTAAGTTEVGGVSQGMGKPLAINGADPNGLAPRDFVTFGSEALFFGTDAAGFDGLWSTDGTKDNTIELGSSVQAAGRGPNWDPTNFAAFGSHVIFNAYDSSGDGTTYKGLWVTDGTLAGTQEIGGLRNVGIYDSNASSFEAIDALAFGNLAFFNAQNAEGDETLWVTDGTAQGTVELGGENNAGVVGANNTGLGDGFAHSVQFGARVFFNGEDMNDAAGLWVTDGTAAGTQEVGGLSDAGLTSYFQHPSSLGLNPVDLTVNGQKVLFNGRDAVGYQELWVTDGAAQGTQEIGGEGVGGFLANEAADGVNPNDIVSLGNGKAVFIGYDDSNNEAGGKATLWVTDGTYAGTQEVGGLDNLHGNIAGINSTGFNFTSELVGGDGLAYFIGEDAAGQFVLWQTDGTALGTKIDAATDGNAGAQGLTGVSNMALAAVPAAQDSISGGGQVVNLDSIPGETLDISSTSGAYDTVNGSNGIVNLTLADAYVVGGGVLVTIGIGSAVGLYATNSVKDSVFGSKGAVTLDDAQANVIGENNTVTFAQGTSGNVVYLEDTDGVWDTVDGSNGTIYLANAQASVVGGGDTIYLDGSSSDVVSLYNTAGAWDTVYGSNGVVNLTNAQASLVGGADAVYLDGSSSDILSLYDTNNAWDAVDASNATINISNAQASLTGGGDAVYLDGSPSDVVSLYNTNKVWDTVNGSNATVNVTNAQTSLVGGADAVYLDGSKSDVVSLYNSVGAWDSIYGANATVNVTNAQTNLVGGADAVYLDGSKTDVVSLYNTAGAWDSIYGANATVNVTNAQTNLVGGADAVYFDGSPSDVVSLYDTAGAWDTISGSNAVVDVTKSQTSIVGGADAVYLDGSSSDVVSLYNTAGAADAVQGANATINLSNAEANLFSGGETIYLGGTDTLGFQPAFGLDTINGYTSADTLVFSVADQGKLAFSQSSGNTLITLDGSDVLTLTNVLPANLGAINYA